MGNKQKELDMCTYLQGYDLIGIKEMWWGGSGDWTAGIEAYRLFKKNRQGRGGGGVAFYVMECMELCLRMDEEMTES